MFNWLKKSTAENVASNCEVQNLRRRKRKQRGESKTQLFTANHSFRSSPSGKITANNKFPDPNL